MVKLCKMSRVDVRTIWPNEARDFTPWLAQNITLLGEALGMDLEVTALESPVGNYNADILAKDLNNSSVVVIENQYGTTDHDHLGKLLTYASGVNAQTLVWITETLRDEHRQSLEWLNERTDTETRFFAIELELLRIEESPVAPNFKLIVSPNDWRKSKTSGKAPSPKGEAYRTYFQLLIDELRDKHHFTNARVAGSNNWYSFASGYSGLQYVASFATERRARIELYIDRGDQAANKQLFDWLFARKSEIEIAFNESLAWERLDDRRASRIAFYRPGDILSPAEELAEIRAWMVDRLLKFRQVFGPLLSTYMHENA